MYKSPIEIYYGNMRTQIENDIFSAVQSYGIAVEEEELIRALKYDREQYDKGYSDGKADAMAELVRCKDCRWSEPAGPYEFNYGEADYYCNFCGHAFKYRTNRENLFRPIKESDDFCSYGERSNDYEHK